MSLASVLLILAALASPASEARHVDAVKILSYDFDRWTDAVALGLRRDIPP